MFCLHFSRAIVSFTLLCVAYTSAAATITTQLSADDSATSSTAKFSETSTELAKQRKIFLKAEYAAGLSKSSDYRRLYKQLDDYPLQPYVEFAHLKTHATLRNKDEIRAFLVRYEDSPLAWPLRKKWLTYLARHHKQALFIEDYAPSSDRGLLCYYLRFQLEANASESAIFDQVDELWLSKNSQPKPCDPLFDLWQQTGRRTPEKISQRLALVAAGGDHTLIPYLKKISPPEQQYLADLWYKARRDPRSIRKLSAFKHKNDQEKAILIYAIKRLIWRDQTLALRTWPQIQQQFNVSQAEKAEVALVFAVRLAQAGDDKANHWLEMIAPEQLTEDIAQWLVTDSLRRGDWSQTLTVLQSLPPALAKQEIWTYWLARSLEQTGATDDANLLFKKVALERHFYGFLAASLLNQQPNMANQPLTFSAEELQAVNDNPAVQRAMELRHLERFGPARREWNLLSNKLNDREKLAAAKWANQNNWFDRAIFALAKQEYWDDVDLRFPLAYQQELSFHSNRNQLEPAFTYAITRRESSFMSDAYSPAGALGLMQVMPSTAKFIAKKSVSRHNLFTPDTNLRYGTDYLKYVLKSLEGNEVVAVAAYNAGVSRVKQWINIDQPMPVDIWIETIPFKETREYVKSVLTYRQIYSHLLGSDENKFKPLTTMQIGL